MDKNYQEVMTMTKATKEKMKNTRGGSIASKIVTKGSKLAWKIYECNRDTNKWGRYARCSCGMHPGFKRV